MPEGKKPVLPSPAAPAAAKEDSYSAKTHLHQPVPVTEMATVAATALPANAPEGTLPSEVRPEIVTWEKLVEAIKASGKAYNMAMIEKAYDLANDAHKGVCRRSGEPYICHPLAVARLVLDLGMDTESIAAALMHDVAEDTPVTIDEIRQKFASEVALLVDGVTKLGQLSYSADKVEVQAENLRKMFLAMAKDIRVILIKLADRLHNMRTLQYMRPEKQQEKARETMDIYAPIAQRLGISKIKVELDDLSLKYLEPDVYYDLVDKIAMRKSEREKEDTHRKPRRRRRKAQGEGSTNEQQ